MTLAEVEKELGREGRNCHAGSAENQSARYWVGDQGGYIQMGFVDGQAKNGYFRVRADLDEPEDVIGDALGWIKDWSG